MKVWQQQAAVGLALIAALTTSITGVSAGSSTTSWVDDDGRAGPSGCAGSATAFTSVQEAVTASRSQDTVVVCPAVYDEQVRIRGARHGLTVRSAVPFGATIRTPTTLAAPLGFRYLVLVDHVDGVTIQGFKFVARTDLPCDPLDVTVGTVGSRATAIRGNRLLSPGSGDTADCLTGVGVVVADSLTSGEPGGGPASYTASAVIAFNEVRDAAFAGIYAVGGTGRVDVQVIHNSVRSYFAYPDTGGSSLAVRDGQIGIALVGRALGVVRDNVVQGAAAGPPEGSVFNVGVAVISAIDSVGVHGANGPIDIRGNLIRRTYQALLMQDADQLTIRRNQVRNSYVGILLDDTTASAVLRNQVAAKSGGLIVNSGSSGNVVRQNSVAGTGGWCVDESSGSSTAGTANAWTGNTATQGSYPTGICVEP